FPFPPLPKGEFHPRGEVGKEFAGIKRDAQIVRWFIQDEMELDFEASPLGELQHVYEQADPNMPLPDFESIPVDRKRHDSHRGTQYQRLAWAICVLYGSDAVEQMDGSFVSAEVLGA